MVVVSVDAFSSNNERKRVCERERVKKAWKYGKSTNKKKKTMEKWKDITYKYINRRPSHITKALSYTYTYIYIYKYTYTHVRIRSMFSFYLFSTRKFSFIPNIYQHLCTEFVLSTESIGWCLIEHLSFFCFPFLSWRSDIFIVSISILAVSSSFFLVVLFHFNFFYLVPKFYYIRHQFSAFEFSIWNVMYAVLFNGMISLSSS